MKVRERFCEVEECRVGFMPRNSFQTWCSHDCGAVLGLRKLAAKAKKEKAAEAKKAREARVSHRRAVEKAKPMGWWLEKAQRAVNRYVRLRDHGLGCISCDKGPDWQGQWHACHWRSVGAASSIRFNLWNIHKGCAQCNHFESGNIAEYTPRIIDKIGAEKADWLKAQNTPRKWTREYLGRLTEIFNKKWRRLEKRIKSGYAPL